MASYLEMKYSAHSDTQKVFLRSMAQFELLLSEPQVMDIQRSTFGRPMLRMTKQQFFILIEEGMKIDCD